MTWEDIQGRTYDPIGRCIYCGSDGGEIGLGDEHLVPYSLGGHAKLREASCRACEAITSEIEMYLARHVFYQFRSHVRAPTRHKKLPTSLPANVSVAGQESVVNLPVADHPFALMLPTWDYPGIMRQAEPSQYFAATNIRVYNFIPTNLRQTLGLADEAPDPVVHVGPGTLDNIKFARAITKIAYCNAVATYGIDGFRHLVTPDIILGRYPYVPYFVGSDPGAPPPPHQKKLRHLVELATISGPQGLCLMEAKVRLFADSGTPAHGMPVYRVVMGAPR